MHSDPAAIKKSVRTYFMVGAALFAGTVITVIANQVHLAIPIAITVALIIALTKGSMVAAVFMHLSHEKKWIYGALGAHRDRLPHPDGGADVHDDGLDRHAGRSGGRAARRDAEALNVVESIPPVLHRRVGGSRRVRGGMGGGQYQAAHAVTYAVTSVVALASGVGLACYGAAFQRKTRRL